MANAFLGDEATITPSSLATNGHRIAVRGQRSSSAVAKVLRRARAVPGGGGVRSRRVWQSATLGLSLLLVLAGAPTGAEPETRAGSYEPALLSQRPSNLILQLPNFGDRLPLLLWPVQGP